MFHTYVLMLVGFLLLWKGADFLVKGGSALAASLGVSPLLIGLTVVSFGTSAPELGVNLAAALRGSTDIALGNVLGSNLANTLLVLGVAAVIRTIVVENRTVRVEMPIAAAAALVLLVLINDDALVGRASALDRVDGLILLLFFALFVYYVFLRARSHPHPRDGEPALSGPRAGAYMVAGAVALGFGSEWLVDGASAIAVSLGMRPALVGLTVVAVGTSLPELVTSAVAAAKGSADIAVGNVIGSNIFNVFLVLGVTAVITPIPPDPDTNLDIAAVLLSSVALAFIVLARRKHALDRVDGVLLLGFYALFLVSLGLRVV